jgi:hypothetical protein
VPEMKYQLDYHWKTIHMAEGAPSCPQYPEPGLRIYQEATNQLGLNRLSSSDVVDRGTEMASLKTGWRVPAGSSGLSAWAC